MELNCSWFKNKRSRIGCIECQFHLMSDGRGNGCDGVRALADDGAVIDVCAGTGAGPTRRYYFDRPAVTGGDDRGGAMALLASLEVHDFEKMWNSGRR